MIGVTGSVGVSKLLKMELETGTSVFARNAGHTDRAVKQQTLLEALEYVW
jgi:iron(III)-enterobactin esterase